MDEKAGYLRQLPAVDNLLQDDKLVSLCNRISRQVVVENIRQVLQRYRDDWQPGTTPPERETIVEEIVLAVEASLKPSLRQVINATGVVLHTNLGRAVLSKAAREAVQTINSGYSNLEFDLQQGIRGSRYAHLRELLLKLTGAEEAMVVNNNAAAVLLSLKTLGEGKETIVSRGQLVEIGGSFRVPEVMLQSGSRLVEVGTTNKTYLKDYETAITEQTAILLKVHTSNYRVVGFTHETTREELVELGRKYRLPVVEDLGSGFLVDLSAYGLKTDEPTVQEAIASGVDVVTFSGDKLLGGPQAGIIVGKKEIINRMQKNPLTRALRIDKMTVAALEATLKEYLSPKDLIRNNPSLSMLTESIQEVKTRAERLEKLLRDKLGDSASISLAKDVSQAGGGALPLMEIPTYTVVLEVSGISVEKAAADLRLGEPAVVARAKNERLVFDLRTVSVDEMMPLAEAIQAVLMR